MTTYRVIWEFRSASGITFAKKYHNIKKAMKHYKELRKDQDIKEIRVREEYKPCPDRLIFVNKAHFVRS